MNPKYHGDAKDLFKRGWLNLVRGISAIHHLRVLPLFTGEYKSTDITAYARILGIEEDDLISRDRFYPRQGRKEYLSVACQRMHEHDLFVDPDRGVVAELRDESSDKEVLSFEEVSFLVGESSGLLLIYDESVSIAHRERATSEKLDGLGTTGLSVFAYFNSSPNHPNILAVSGGNGRQRLRQFREELVTIGIPRAKLLPQEGDL
jgi:hypothetical protein